MSLDGPSRRIQVEPLQEPAVSPQPEREEPVREREPVPERETEKVPA